MTTPSPLPSLPADNLSNVLSFVTLKDALGMRLVCAHFRRSIFEATHHLWMDVDEEETTERDIRMSARQMRRLLASFPKLRCLRLAGLRLTHQSLVSGTNGAAANPRYVCGLLQEADSAQNLECLELCAVSESQAVSGEWGAATFPSYSMHTDVRLERLRKLTIEGSFCGENPLVHSLLRASHLITHLNLTGCANFNDHDAEEAIMKPLASTLTHLNLSGSGIQHPTIHSTILKTLVLKRCINLRALNPESFCPSLDVLDLSHSPLFHGEGMFDAQSGLSNMFPRLVKLNLSNCTGLKNIRINFPLSEIVDSSVEGSVEEPDQIVPSRLENVDLSKCVHLSSATISCPMKRIDLGKCMHLKVLSISAPYLEMLDLSSLPLMLISLSCQSLVHLNLAKCNELDSKHSIIKCKSLESVDIRGAMYMTPEFFDDPHRTCKLSVHRDDLKS